MGQNTCWDIKLEMQFSFSIKYEPGKKSQGFKGQPLKCKFWKIEFKNRGCDSINDSSLYDLAVYIKQSK